MSQFTPIDIFRIDAQILSEKMDQIKRYVQLDEKFSRGMLYFYFSWEIEEVSQKGCFRKFKEFLQQNYPDTFPFHFLYQLHRRANRSYTLAENNQGVIFTYIHEYGLYGNEVDNHDSFFETTIRTFGEKVDHGYDPLGELVASGLKSDGIFHTFLTKGLYDPRVLILIHRFAYDPDKEKLYNVYGKIVEEDLEESDSMSFDIESDEEIFGESDDEISNESDEEIFDESNDEIFDESDEN